MRLKNLRFIFPYFQITAKKGFEEKNPLEIVDEFFELYGQKLTETDRHDLLFAFIQFIERQVVLFDAIEDAAFAEVNNMHGRGTCAT